SPSTGCAAGKADQRLRISGSRLGTSGGKWITTKTAAGRSAGKPPTSAETASTPPVEAPTTMTSCPDIALTLCRSRARGLRKLVVSGQAHTIPLIPPCLIAEEVNKWGKLIRSLRGAP